MDTAGKSIGDRRPLLYLRLLTRRVNDQLGQICSHSSLIRRFGHSAQPPTAGFRVIIFAYRGPAPVVITGSEWPPEPAHAREHELGKRRCGYRRSQSWLARMPRWASPRFGKTGISDFDPSSNQISRPDWCNLHGGCSMTSPAKALRLPAGSKHSAWSRGLRGLPYTLRRL